MFDISKVIMFAWVFSQWYSSFVKVGDKSLIIHKSAYHLFSFARFKTRFIFSANEENIR